VIDVIGISYLTTAVYALTAFVGVWALLRLLDRSGSRPWTETMDIIRRNPIATAVYYGARFCGACLLVGMVMSG
jgi:hypothetical protein